MMNGLRSGLLATLLMVPGLALSAGHEAFFDSTLGDLTEELGVARDEGKKGVLLFFEMDECPFCAWMKANVLNDPEVQAYFREHFLIIPVDIEGDIELVDFQGNATTQKAFAQKGQRVRATPVFGFFDLDGKRVTRYTGKTRDSQEFLWLGEYVVSEAWRDRVPFTRYKMAKRKAEAGD